MSNHSLVHSDASNLVMVELFIVTVLSFALNWDSSKYIWIYMDSILKITDCPISPK